MNNDYIRIIKEQDNLEKEILIIQNKFFKAKSDYYDSFKNIPKEAYALFEEFLKPDIDPSEGIVDLYSNDIDKYNSIHKKLVSYSGYKKFIELQKAHDQLEYIYSIAMLSYIHKLNDDRMKLFEKEGLLFKGHTTSGFFGPYVWKKTEEKKYHVEIPNGVVELPVYFMHGYLMNSWLDYVSLGEIGTGGWSEKEGLYCNFNLYESKLDKPEFEISFLKHEAQHSIDFRNKKYYMNSTVLEYRAKLSELVYYPNLDLLKIFMRDAKNDKKLTHPQAQFWIVEELSKQILHKDYSYDIKEWESKLPDIQQYCKDQLLNFNRCKRNRLIGTLRYYVETLFI